MNKFNPNKIYTALFLILFTGIAVFAQCDIDQIITNQSDLDQFFSLNDCEVYDGDLTIDFSGAAIDLSPLSNLTSVNGDFHINANNLSSLEDLNSLTYVGGNFSIAITLEQGSEQTVLDVESPNSLQGLNNLVEVQGEFKLQRMPFLTNLTGLDNLISVNHLILRDLNELNTFNGMNALESITSLKLITLPSITSLESFPDIQFLGGSLSVGQIEGLENLDGLDFIPNTISSLSLSSLINITEAADLEVLSNITTISNDFSISNLGLTNLDAFSNLNFIGDDFGLLVMEFLENIDGLSNLTHIGGDISLQFLALSSFEGLYNVADFNGALDLILVSINQSTLDFSFPFESLQRLTINGLFGISLMGFTEMSGFHELQNIEEGLFINGFAELQSLSGFEQLNSVGQDFTFTEMFQIQDMPSFNALQSIGGDLKIAENDSLKFAATFDSLESIGDSLIVTENPVLENCCDLFELALICQGGSVFEGNGPLCDIDLCELDYTLINLHSFLDFNENGVLDNDEVQFTDLTYQISPQEYLVSPNENGLYDFYVENGDYSVEISIPSLWELSVGNQVENITTEGNEVLDLYYGFTPFFEIHKNEIDFTITPTICNTAAYAWIDYYNIGSLTNTGYISFEPDSLTNLVWSEPAWDYEEEGLYYWNYTDLYPSQSGQIHLHIEMPDENEFGEVIALNSVITALNEQDQILDQTSHKHFDEIVCAYDPNDKLVSPEGVEEENYTLFEDTVLTYTIRFQNTGNFPATNVRVEDTLDLNLDIHSFEFLSASHSVKTTLSLLDRSLLFDFENINLPDSVNNEPESHGFVKFRIKKKDDLPEFTPIENTGFIYFDFNSAIVTNTVRNTFVSEIPTALTSIISRENKMKISPNPASDYTTLFFDETPEQGSKILVVDIQGEFVREMGEISNKAVRLEADNLREGIYFIRLLGKNGRTMAVQKLLVSP